MGKTLRAVAGVLLASALGPASALAAPVTYLLTEGTLDTVFIVSRDADGNVMGTRPTDPPPTALTGASITVDLDTGELLDMSLSLAGPVELDLGGVNGWASVTFSDAQMQTTASTGLIGSGPFDAAGVASTVSALVDLEPVDPTGLNPGVLPGGGDTITDLVQLSILENGLVQVDVNGLVLGQLGAVVAGELSSATVTANFSFQAAPIPEPGSGLLFSLGLVVTGMGVRRRLEV